MFFLKARLRICMVFFNSYLKDGISINFEILSHFTLLFPRISVSVKEMVKLQSVVTDFRVTVAVKDALKISSAKLLPREILSRILK